MNKSFYLLVILSSTNWRCCCHHERYSSFHCIMHQCSVLFSSRHSSTQGYQRLKACWKWRVCIPRQNCPLDMEDECKWSERVFQMTGVATLKLCLRSSVVVLSMTRSPRSTERRPARPRRFAVGMQTCWKYAVPAPRIQFNVRNAILSCIC